MFKRWKNWRLQAKKTDRDGLTQPPNFLEGGGDTRVEWCYVN